MFAVVGSGAVEGEDGVDGDESNPGAMTEHRRPTVGTRVP